MTKTITRAEYDSPARRLGGDFWNPWKIAAVAFRQFPEASAVSWGYLGTGLWVDATVTTPNGAVTARLFS